VAFREGVSPTDSLWSTEGRHSVDRQAARALEAEETSLGRGAEVPVDVEQAQVAGTGHFVMMEKPEEFNRLLVAFVDKQAQ